MQGRAKRWFEESGAKALADSSSLMYEEYCRRVVEFDQVPVDDARQIDLDVPRTTVSMHKYVLREFNVNEDCHLSTEKVEKHMVAVRRLTTAYAVVSASLRLQYNEAY